MNFSSSSLSSSSVVVVVVVVHTIGVTAVINYKD
jgi:hypothetical protein